MYVATLLSLMLAADPVPVAGRPKDFSGAIGGPFIVTTTAEPTTVKVGEPITFTIRITGPGDLSAMRRPDLEHDSDFAAFTVEAGPEGDLSPGHEFQYLLRPRSDAVKMIPRMKLVYFNPAIQPAERGFQTTYSEQLEIRVNGPDWPPPLPPHIEAWVKAVEQNPNSASKAFNRAYRHILFGHHESESIAPMLFVALWLVPPLACATWYVIARRVQAKSDTPRTLALRRLHGILDNSARQIDSVVREFLTARIGQDFTNATSDDMTTALRNQWVSEDVVERVQSLLDQLDAEKYGRASHSAGESLRGSAIDLVTIWRVKS